MEFRLPVSSSNLGVEIQNINIAKTLSDKEINGIREQWVNYGVAIFPNQKLNLEEYENFSQQFGPFGEEPFLIFMQKKIIDMKKHRQLYLI